MFCRSQTKINGSGSSFQNHQKTTRISESRLTLGSTGWVFVCLAPCQTWPHNRKKVFDCHPVITSLCETLLQTRQDQERGIIGQASFLHSWHWVWFHGHLYSSTESPQRRWVLICNCFFLQKIGPDSQISIWRAPKVVLTWNAKFL